MVGVQGNSQTADVDYHVVGPRLIAALVDLALLSALFFVMSMMFGNTDTSTSHKDSNTTVAGNVSLTGGPFLLYVALVFIYYTAFEAISGKTIGKLVTGIKVARYGGRACGLRASCLRNILRVIDGLPVGYLVGLVCISATARRQRLGDLAAGTLVVREIREMGTRDRG